MAVVDDVECDVDTVEDDNEGATLTRKPTKAAVSGANRIPTAFLPLDLFRLANRKACPHLSRAAMGLICDDATQTVHEKVKEGQCETGV